ncbi:hypothetical protein DyAD56_16200 [Dyella sp. AD56]|uniref:helix-turn-helix domain-containing transcriptional regulator n=1 Tax=Dyella sp. AD56 TaxID=1528744 RepID=UPI000CAD8E27|nr:hypothetical protein [Dyella sp. AD56]PMQ04230.1 hypothetical protein DyAD56_16200 [Dyella sp. AD56]
MTDKLIPFDIVDYLDSEEAIAEYLSQVQAEGDPDELQRALIYVAKAREILRAKSERSSLDIKPAE